MSYPGGKGGAFQHLINRIPPHRLYVESHLGGGAVLRRKRPAAHSIGIDLDHGVLRRFASRRDFTAIHGDATAVLPNLNLYWEDFVYCDPPYLRQTRSGGRLYRFEADEEHHHRLLELVRSLPCRVMISGYANEVYDRALEGWRSENFSIASRAGKRTETVWMNYSVDALHDDRFLGGSFREREQFRRKRSRWRNQFARLPLLQQQAIYKDLRTHIEALKQPDRTASRYELAGAQLSLPGFETSAAPA